MVSNISRLLRPALFFVLAAAMLGPKALGMTIDGRIDELEWQSAQRFDQFRVMEPLSGAIPEYASTMPVLSQPRCRGQPTKELKKRRKG